MSVCVPRISVLCRDNGIAGVDFTGLEKSLRNVIERRAVVWSPGVVLEDSAELASLNRNLKQVALVEEQDLFYVGCMR